MAMRLPFFRPCNGLVRERNGSEETWPRIALGLSQSPFQTRCRETGPTKMDSPVKGLGLTGTMRLPRSPLLAPLLIIALLVSLTAAAWAVSWAVSVALWTLSGAIALIVFAVLLRDDD